MNDWHADWRASAGLREQYGTAPTTLGALSVDSVAKGFGTDRKTLLLVGGAGLVGGYLLNDALRTAKQMSRRVRRKVGKTATPRNLIILGVLAAIGGGAYLYWSHHRSSQPALPAPTPVKPKPVGYKPPYKLPNGTGYAPTQRVTVS